MGHMSRIYVTNSSGDPQDGDPIDDELFQELQTAVETEFYSANHPSATTNAIIDNLIAGVPFFFGGDADESVYNLVDWPVGATLDKIVPKTGVWRVDTAHLQEGSYQLEAMAGMVANDQNGGDILDDYGQLALFDLTGATPNVPIANSLIQGIGAGDGSGLPKLLRSAVMTATQLPAPFTTRDLAVKWYWPGAQFWNIRFIRID